MSENRNRGAPVNPEKRTHKFPVYYLYGLGTMLIWSSTFSFTKVSLEAFSVPMLSILRFIFAGLFMLAPGGFFIFGILIAGVNFFSKDGAKKEFSCKGCMFADRCGLKEGEECEGKEAEA